VTASLSLSTLPTPLLHPLRLLSLSSPLFWSLSLLLCCCYCLNSIVHGYACLYLAVLFPATHTRTHNMCISNHTFFNFILYICLWLFLSVSFAFSWTQGEGIQTRWSTGVETAGSQSRRLEWIILHICILHIFICTCVHLHTYLGKSTYTVTYPTNNNACRSTCTHMHNVYIDSHTKPSMCNDILSTINTYFFASILN